MNRYIGIFALSITLLCSTNVFGQTHREERESSRLLVTSARHRQSDKSPARLIIYRLPNLGNIVFVDLWIDGAVAGPIGWGQTYETYLSPGTHVLSMLPTPSPTWHTSTEFVLHVRPGETYEFTAATDHSGYLILQKGSMVADNH